MASRVVAYIRVSTEEQAEHGYSIDVQRQVLEDYARGHDLTVVETFVESQSAFKPGRSEFTRMVELLKKSKAIRAVLVYKIDRISRNLHDYSTLVEEMGVEIVSATEQLPSNATGRLMGDMQAAFSRYFSAQLSDRVAEAMAAKARKGIYPSYAPTGYINNSETRTIEIDPEKADLVRQAFVKYDETDMTVKEVAAWARKRGLTTRRGGKLGKSTLHVMLQNPMYCGIVRWGEVTAPGNHEPLISEALFDRVQDKLHGRGRGRRNNCQTFPFRGLLTCGHCGCKITASRIKGRYVYYHCTNGRGKCAQPRIRQEKLSDMLVSIVDNVRVPQDVVEELMKAIRGSEQGRREHVTKQLAHLATRLKSLRKTRDQAYIDRLGGVIDEERWRRLDAAWEDEIAQLQDEKRRLEQALHARASDDATEAFELLDRASELYSSQSPSEQADALKILVSNCTLTGEKLDPNYRKPFDLVAEGLRTGNWYARQDSNL